MPRAPTITSARPVADTTADPPRVRCAPGSPATVQVTCPHCQHPFPLSLSTPALANPHLPLPTPAQPPPPTVETTTSSRYSLCRNPVCWVLLFRDGSAYLKHEIGLGYVAYLLSHPDEHVPSATLFSRFSTRQRNDLPTAELPDPETGALTAVADGVGIPQSQPDQDEAEARDHYYAQLREYKETFNDGSLPESERDEARHRYDELVAFLKEHYRPERDAGSDVTRLVHRSIQRLCTNLRKPVGGQSVPDPAAQAFAEYIERHILVPSRRYTRAKAGTNVRVARGELAGRLIFECPPGHRWSVVA